MNKNWRRNRAEVHHGEDWLMTYADVITLLLCFFVIIVVTKIPKKETQPDPIQQMKEEKLAPPQEITTPQPAKPLDSFAIDLPFHNTDSGAPPKDVPPPAQTAQVKLPPENMALAPMALSEIAADSRGQAKLEQTGNRITTLELKSTAFFDSGSATLNKDGESILRKVTAELKGDKYKGYRITVEGHTDDTPIHTVQFPSNWELSTGRASAVVRFFLEQGLRAADLRAAGYADTFPKTPNRDTNGHAIPINQAENRRVVINLEKINRDE